MKEANEAGRKESRRALAPAPPVSKAAASDGLGRGQDFKKTHARGAGRLRLRAPVAAAAAVRILKALSTVRRLVRR